MHALHISNSHTEWNLLSTLSKYGDKICKQRVVELNNKLGTVEQLYTCQPHLLLHVAGMLHFIFLPLRTNNRQYCVESLQPWKHLIWLEI